MENISLNDTYIIRQNYVAKNDSKYISTNPKLQSDV